MPTISIPSQINVRYDDIGGWVRSVRHNRDRWAPDDTERDRRDRFLKTDFSLIESTLEDATVALEQFRQGMDQFWTATRQWQEEIERWKEGYPHNGPSPKFDDRFIRKVLDLAARSFVFALDILERCIQSLAAEPWAPGGLDVVVTTWKVDFENVRKIRDSLHHVDERIHRVARGKAMPYDWSGYIAD